MPIRTLSRSRPAPPAFAAPIAAPGAARAEAEWDGAVRTLDAIACAEAVEFAAGGPAKLEKRSQKAIRIPPRPARDVFAKRPATGFGDLAGRRMRSSDRRSATRVARPGRVPSPPDVTDIAPARTRGKREASMTSAEMTARMREATADLAGAFAARVPEAGPILAACGAGVGA